MVEINGAIYTTQGNSIAIHKLRAGSYNLKVIRKTTTGHRHMVRTVIYNSSIRIQQRSTVHASINRPHNLQITNVVRHQQQVTHNNNHHHQNNNHYNNNGGGYYDHHTDSYYGHNNGNGYYNNNNNSCHHSNGMTQQEFKRLLYRIDREPSAYYKKKIAMNTIQSRGVYTHQIKILMNRFYSDFDKLEIAKSSFYHTIDPQNYSILNRSFYYQSSVNELTCFVRQH